VASFPSIFAWSAAALVALSYHARTQELGGPIDLERLRGVPGLVIEDGTQGSNTTIIRKGGVEIHQTLSGGQMQTFGVDKSGQGAVLCTWQILITMRAVIDACYAKDYAELRRSIDEDIGKINTFISQNNLTPITQREIDLLEASRSKKLGDEWGSSPSESCSTDPMLSMIKAMAELGRAESMKRLEEFLGTPRPPVTNPCL